MQLSSYVVSNGELEAAKLRQRTCFSADLCYIYIVGRLLRLRRQGLAPDETVGEAISLPNLSFCTITKMREDNILPYTTTKRNRREHTSPV